MADNLVKYGLRWDSAYNGGKSCPAGEYAIVATGYQAAINSGTNVDLQIGDIVRRVASGTVELADGSEGASSAETMYGVIVGVRPYWDGTVMRPSNKLPGGTEWGTVQERKSQLMVVPVTAGTWSIDVDDAVTATTEAAYQALIGENADFVNTNTSAAIGAEPQLDISSHVATTASFRIIAVSGTVENQDFAGANIKLLVAANEVQNAPFVTAGV